METKTVVQNRIDMENKIFKNINKEILKAAKKGDFHYYWDVTGLNSFLIKSITEKLENENRFVKSKGDNFRIIRW